MTWPVVLAALAFVLTLVPAAAGTSVAAGRPVALTAAPARLAFRGSGSDTVRVRNSGSKRVAVDVSAAGFGLDLRGRPRIVRGGGARSATRWLAVRPAHLTLAAHGGARLHVSARVPHDASPGDHDALVVLSTRPLARGRVSVRLRLGVVVIVRAPGAVVRRLELGRLRISRRALELAVVNAGNVTERLRRVRVALARLPANRHLETLVASPRELRPRTRGVIDFPLRERVHGLVAARVVVPGEPGRTAIRRTYRLRL